MLLSCSWFSLTERVRQIPNVNDSLFIGMELLFLLAYVICAVRESLCVNLEAERVTAWTKVLWSIHWLFVYSH
jgi:hypothetical protein